MYQLFAICVWQFSFIVAISFLCVIAQIILSAQASFVSVSTSRPLTLFVTTSAGIQPLFIMVGTFSAAASRKTRLEVSKVDGSNSASLRM